MNIYSIYKATNIVNNKCYIGWTSNFKQRKITHLSESFNISSKGYPFYFHKAIRKYGFINFQWDILFQSKDGEYLKNEMEPYFISYYNSFGKGYNLTPGGDGTIGKIPWNKGLTKETNEIIKEYSKKISHPKSEQGKQNMKGKTGTTGIGDK